MVFFSHRFELFPVYKLRCLERQYAFRLLENSYVIVFAKTSSHKMLLNISLNIFNIQLQGRRDGLKQISGWADSFGKCHLQTEDF